jgi:hypothetical protein
MANQCCEILENRTEPEPTGEPHEAVTYCLACGSRHFVLILPEGVLSLEGSPINPGMKQ